MKNIHKILLLLCLYVFISGVYYKWFYFKPLTKQEFYLKHHIENDSIIPVDFDIEKLREFIAEKYSTSQADEKISFLISSMAAPEQYAGFYRPKEKLVFYSAENLDNLYKLGLDASDIRNLALDEAEKTRKELTFGLSEEELEKRGYYSLVDTGVLVSKIGNDIYLIGIYTDCGTSGCSIDMYVKNKLRWIKRNADLLFDSCTQDNRRQIYKCDIVGGYNDDLRNLSADYLPLRILYDRYYEIYEDYIYQYIQKRKK